MKGEGANQMFQKTVSIRNQGQQGETSKINWVFVKSTPPRRKSLAVVNSNRQSHKNVIDSLIPKPEIKLTQDELAFIDNRLSQENDVKQNMLERQKNIPINTGDHRLKLQQYRNFSQEVLSDFDREEIISSRFEDYYDESADPVSPMLTDRKELEGEEVQQELTMRKIVTDRIAVKKAVTAKIILDSKLRSFQRSSSSVKVAKAIGKYSNYDM